MQLCGHCTHWISCFSSYRRGHIGFHNKAPFAGEHASIQYLPHLLYYPQMIRLLSGKVTSITTLKSCTALQYHYEECYQTVLLTSNILRRIKINGLWCINTYDKMWNISCVEGKRYVWCWKGVMLISVLSYSIITFIYHGTFKTDNSPSQFTVINELLILSLLIDSFILRYQEWYQISRFNQKW